MTANPGRQVAADPAGRPEDPAAAPGARSRRGRPAPRTVTMAVSGLASLVLLFVAALVHVPYVIESPGPVINTLGTVKAESGRLPLIEVSGHPTYPTEGSLDLLTVSVAGGPRNGISLPQVLTGWFDRSQAVVPEELVYPPGRSQQAVQRENDAMMTSSQQNAIAAALGELDIPFTTRLVVRDFTPGAPSAAVLRKGDVITGIGGREVGTFDQLREAVGSGSGPDVALTVDRSGTTHTLTVATTRGDGGDRQLGVQIERQFDFPFQVKIQLDDVGGPSAGMMFALGIMDKLSPGPLTGGDRIAGTGTIDPDGSVGAIGGIRQKMIGARDAGAEWFLAPKANCDEVVGHVPDGLHVAAVGTLHDAHQAVADIAAGSGTSSLPTCQAGRG